MIIAKFQNLQDLNSKTFKGFSSTVFKHLICFQALSRALKFLFQIQAFSRISQARYEPCTDLSLWVTQKLGSRGDSPSFAPGLKTSLSAIPSYCRLPLLQDWLHGFPGLSTDTSEHVRFYFQFLLYSPTFFFRTILGMADGPIWWPKPPGRPTGSPAPYWNLELPPLF